MQLVLHKHPASHFLCAYSTGTDIHKMCAYSQNATKARCNHGSEWKDSSIFLCSSGDKGDREGSIRLHSWREWREMA